MGPSQGMLEPAKARRIGRRRDSDIPLVRAGQCRELEVPASSALCLAHGSLEPPVCAIEIPAVLGQRKRCSTRRYDHDNSRHLTPLPRKRALHGMSVAADDCNEIAYAPRPRSRNMMISPNLVAALEYDEQTRGASRTSLEHARPPSPGARTTGLPPPPRPKSRAGSLHKSKSPPLSPSTPFAGDTTVPPSPAPLSPGPSSGHGAMSIAANPYINPPPPLPHFYMEAAHSRSFSLPFSITATRRSSVESSSVRTSESPQSEQPSPNPASSPESTEGSVAPSEGRLGFQRHFRYLSSLPKVEKMLVKGKTRVVGKQGDGRQRDGGGGRRGSVGGSPEAEHSDRSMRERLPGVKERRRIRGGARAGSEPMALFASSAPASPVTRLDAAGMRVVDAASGGVAESRPESRRSVGVLPDVAPAAGARPLRPLISHARRASAVSTCASSDESHEPNTPSGPRISVSSTIYHGSTYSLADAHYAPEPWTPPDSVTSHASPTTTLSMDSDTESFIDLASPTFSPRLTDFSSNAAVPHAYPSDHPNPSAYTHPRVKPTLPAISTITTKPPLPTSPKPQFGRRSKSAQPPHARLVDRAESPSGQEITYTRRLPPTTNLLNPVERAEGVRKTRKIAQMFGQTPGAPEALAISRVSFEANVPDGLLCAPSGGLVPGKRSAKHQRGAVSMSVAQGTSDALPQPLWPPPEADASRYAALSARRHSTPLTPDTFSFMDDDEPASPSDGHASSSVGSRHSSAVIEIGSARRDGRSGGVGPTSPMSFMDLTEEDMLADGLLRSSSSIYSFTSDELAEEDRRRKRDKLAKLHRFLGSRVPAEIVLGQLSLDASEDLPPVVPVATAIVEQQPLNPMENDARKAWIRRRRSSSAGELGGKWSDEVDRLKEELNNKEKALNVKRAVKMEKMFGVAPPQTLYHTRSAAPPVGPSTTPPQFQAAPSSPVSPSSRNMNQTAYTRNKIKKNTRPGTAESSEPLISSHGNSRISGAPGFSEIYEHYRHSLNSLNDILDRDDKESLQRLHGLIHGEADAELQPFTRQESPSPPPTPKAERRRSLPTRASITSLASEYSITAGITSTPPEEQAFQARRRRAAKLTQFFGVDYRDLVNEVFESLESGLEEESGRGTLKPDEVQELLYKLRKLKSKRNSLFE